MIYIPPTIDAKKCIGCNKCVEICPTKTLEMKDGKAVVAHPENCVECHACESVCPSGAIIF